MVAVILYVTAPHWPLPVVQPMQMELGRGKTQAQSSEQSGQGGWLSLCLMALSRTGLMLAGVLVLQSLVILILHMGDAADFQLLQFLPFIVIWQMTLFNAQSLRLLRALPGSSLQLAAYLFLLPLALLAVTVTAVLWLLLPLADPKRAAGGHGRAGDHLDVAALLLPAALSLRQTAMGVILSVPDPGADTAALAGTMCRRPGMTSGCWSA